MLCFDLLCYSIVRFCPCSSGLFHRHWINNMIALVPVKEPWTMWVNNSRELTKNSNIAKCQTQPCAYFVGCTTFPSTFCESECLWPLLLTWLNCNPSKDKYSTTICKLVDLIPALRQSDCRIPNWVSAKTVLSSSTNNGQTTARFRSFFR